MNAALKDYKLNNIEELLSFGFGLIPNHNPVKGGGCSCSRGKQCPAPGKHPRINKWQTDWTKDHAQVKAWLKRWPNMNVGIATGEPSGVIVLDVDGEEGMESLRELEIKHGELPDTWRAISGSGWPHIYFRCPSNVCELKNESKFRPGLDIRVNGGQIVAPGSLHPSGNFYEWETLFHPDEVELADMPEWMFNIIRDFCRKNTSESIPAAGELIQEGQRNNTLTRIAGKLRHDGLTEDEILAALLRINQNRCNPPLSENEVKTIANSIGKYAAGDFPSLPEQDFDRQGVRPSIVNLSDVEPEEVNFLWPPYIPLGKLTILEGDPGLGKTFLSLCICAAISNGGVLPDQDGKPTVQLNKGRVLFMTAEDGLADTLVPRLEMMGADRRQISCLTGWRTAESEEEMSFTLADVNVLRAALEEVKPDLVVIDPLQAYLGGSVDMHRANETRPLLSNLGRIAEEYGCAVLAIRHLSKGGSKALYRGLGSIDFTAAARSVLTVGQEPVTKQKGMAHIKSSCAANGVTLSFDIHPDFGFTWSGVSNFTIEDLLASPSAAKDDQEDNGNDSRLEEAIEFLYEILGDGPIESKEIQKQAKQASIKWRTIQRAKEQLEFKAFKEGDVWFWPKLIKKPSVPETTNGADGAVEISPDALRFKGSAPSAPNIKHGTLANEDYKEWLEIGTEVADNDLPF